MDWQQRFRAWRRRKIIRWGKDLRPRLDRLLVRFSVVGDPDVFDADALPGVARVGAEWKAIRRELEALLAHREMLPQLREISPDHDKISDERWRVFFLHGYGRPCERTRRLCPETSRLLDTVPGLYNAFFSILAPGTHVPRHRGVTKGFVTWHIGLIVPEPRQECFLTLDGRRCHWGEGESLVFDDTRHHEVWNRTERERVVLLVNVLRPMRWPGRVLLRLFLAAMNRTRWVSDGRENQAAWEDRFEEALAEDGRSVEAA